MPNESKRLNGNKAKPMSSAADRRDARRYRFLRDNRGNGGLRRRVYAEVEDWAASLGGRKDGPWSSQELYGRDLDIEIDKAMCRRQNKPKRKKHAERSK